MAHTWGHYVHHTKEKSFFTIQNFSDSKLFAQIYECRMKEKAVIENFRDQN